VFDATLKIKYIIYRCPEPLARLDSGSPSSLKASGRKGIADQASPEEQGSTKGPQ